MDRTGDIAQLVPAQLNVAESGDSNDLGRIQDVDGRSYQGISHGQDRIPGTGCVVPGLTGCAPSSASTCAGSTGLASTRRCSCWRAA